MTKENLKTLCDYFNSQATLPPEVREIANDIRSDVYPEIVEKPEKVVVKKVAVKKVAKKTTKK